MKNYDEWKLHSPDDNEKVAFNCNHCDREIYLGHEYLELENLDRVHELCLDDYTRELLDPRIRYAGDESG